MLNDNTLSSLGQIVFDLDICRAETFDVLKKIQFS